MEFCEHVLRLLFITTLLIIISKGQNERLQITWCTINDMEQKKCEDFARAVSNDGSFDEQLYCKQAFDKDQCMNLIDGEKASLVTLDPGELYIAGRYHSLVPIMAERYGPEEADGYYAVAVVHVTSTIYYLRDLQFTKACFPSVGQFAGWVIPMATLIKEEIIEIKDCNNLVKTAANFFGSSCAPNSLIDKFNPTGDNPQHMCALCAGKDNQCSGSNPYANFEGAFNCLIHGGDVAFLKDSTVDEITNQPGYQGPPKSQFRLLCPSGRTESIDNFRSCNWGFVPAHTVVTTSSFPPEVRERYQQFLRKAVYKFGQKDYYSRGNYRNPLNSSYTDSTNFHWPTTQGRNDYFGPNDLNEKQSFRLFKSGSGEDSPYKSYINLLFQDTTTNLAFVESSEQTFTRYLGNRLELYKHLQKCPSRPAILCVVSDKEFRKCHKMQTAFRSQMLKPDLVCTQRYSQRQCMMMIRDNLADLAVLDAGDIYHAGQKFGLIPIIAEQYDLDEPSYYVVAVAQQPDKDTDLLYLKGKRSCHTGVGTAAGWVIPMSFLLTNERMRSFGCNSVRAASEFFQKSCVPGVLSREHTTGDWSYDNLCDLCHGSSSHYCKRDSSEPFYGNTGALRCLVEGGGEIAFVKHTTILENTAGKNQQWWARPMMPGDFELLCRDGTRAKQHEYEQCNLGKVASNAIVTKATKARNIIDTYIDLFLYAQRYYGSKYSEDFIFKMFVSEGQESDLIFQDATQMLKEVPAHKRNYRDYLGHDFIQAMQIVDCTASATNIKCNTYVIMAIVTFLMLKLWIQNS